MAHLSLVRSSFLANLWYLLFFLGHRCYCLTSSGLFSMLSAEISVKGTPFSFLSKFGICGLCWGMTLFSALNSVHIQVLLLKGVFTQHSFWWTVSLCHIDCLAQWKLQLSAKQNALLMSDVNLITSFSKYGCEHFWLRCKNLLAVKNNSC